MFKQNSKIHLNKYILKKRKLNIKYLCLAVSLSITSYFTIVIYHQPSIMDPKIWKNWLKINQIYNMLDYSAVVFT